ncbi:MAG: cytochrome c biogenesis protein/redoxin, partial [Candidatus Levyibacteriota bacterium]
MHVLFFFAFISGLVTIFAPCIWPILPIILSASATGGHRKPLGITLGVVISFGFLTLFLSYILRIIPIDANILRLFAAFIIGILGLTLIVPILSRLLEGSVSRLSGKLQIGGSTSTGFFSGFVVGLALGVVWAPCAGPIFATIAALAATQKVNLDVILVTTFYVIGIGIPLFLFAALGRQIFTKSKALSRYTGRIQQVFGIIMILTAILIATNYDTVIEARLLDFVPSYSTFLNQLEGNSAVKTGLDSLKGKNSIPTNTQDTSGLFNTDVPAADFLGITQWLNPEKNISIKDLRGKVVLVDFWTYTCINCIRTLPYVTSWYDKYHTLGFTVIGIHTPEFEFEKNTQNVQSAIKQFNIHYPVGQDNNYATWNNYNNQYWP